MRAIDEGHNVVAASAVAVAVGGGSGQDIEGDEQPTKADALPGPRSLDAATEEMAAAEEAEEVAAEEAAEEEAAEEEAEAAVDPYSLVEAAVDAAVCAQRAAAAAEAAEQAAEAGAVRSALAAEVRVLDARLAAEAAQLAEQQTELEQLRADAIAASAAGYDVAARRAVEGYVLLGDEMHSLRDAADPAGAEARLAAASSAAAAAEAAVAATAAAAAAGGGEAAEAAAAAAAASAAKAEAAELRAELASGRARIDQLQVELVGLRQSSQEAGSAVPKQDLGVQVYATWTDDVTETSRPNSRQQRGVREAANSARYLLSSREGGRPRSRSDSDITPKVSRLDLEAKLQQLQACGACNPVHPTLQPCAPHAATLCAPDCNVCFHSRRTRRRQGRSTEVRPMPPPRASFSSRRRWRLRRTPWETRRHRATYYGYTTYYGDGGGAGQGP